MESSDLWTIIDSRLGEMFMMIPEKLPPATSSQKKTCIFSIF